MKKFNLFVGVDMGKSEFVVAFRRDNELLRLNDKPSKSYKNTTKGFSLLLADIEALESNRSSVLICVEHTGHYMDKFALAFYGQGYFLWVVNPYVIKHYQISLERGKSDPLDSQRLALFADRNAIDAKAFVPDSVPMRALRDLFRMRRQLVAQRTRVKNQLSSHLQQAAPLALVTQLYKSSIEELNQKIKLVEKELERKVKLDPRMKRIYNILLSVPSIGKVTAWNLLCETRGFTRLVEYKKLACHIGVAPFPHESGSSLKRKPKVSKKAAGEIKKNLTMGTISQIRSGRLFSQYYHYMLEVKGKPHLWIVNSIRNTLLKLVYTLIDKDQIFDKKTFLMNKKSWHVFLELS